LHQQTASNINQYQQKATNSINISRKQPIANSINNSINLKRKW